MSDATAFLNSLLPNPLQPWIPAAIRHAWQALDAERAAAPAAAADPAPTPPFADVATLLIAARTPWTPYALRALTCLGCDDELARGQATALASAAWLLAQLTELQSDCRHGTPWLALDEIARHRSSIAALGSGLVNPALMQANVDRARRLLRAGSPLARRLPARAGFLLRLALLAADERILRLHALDPSALQPFAARHWLRLGAQALWHGIRPQRETRTHP